VNFRSISIPTAHSLQLVLTGGAASPDLLRQIQDEYAATAGDRLFAAALVLAVAVMAIVPLLVVYWIYRSVFT